MKKSSSSHFNFTLLWQELRLPLSMLLVTFFGGTLGFRILYPEAPWHKLFYMTAITLSTVGYTDILGTEDSPVPAVYTMLLILVGMGASVYAVSTLTAFFVEGGLGELLQISHTKRKIAKMRNHYIICGCGTTGIHVIREMERCNIPFVVIDHSHERLNELREEFPTLLGIQGDASHEEMLVEAGIHSATGLVAALTNDKDNLFLTLTARQMNADIKIVSKAVDMNINRRLTIAGANYIVSPYFIGGMRMASEILRPNVVTFLDQMLRGHESDIRIHEETIHTNSKCIGKSLEELEIFEQVGVQILALLPPGPDEQYIYNPPDEHIVEAGTVLLFIGNTAQQLKMAKLTKPS